MRKPSTPPRPLVAALLLALLPAAGACSPPARHTFAPKDAETMSHEADYPALFEAASREQGNAYLDSEKRLSLEATNNTAFLRAQTAAAESTVRSVLLARALMDLPARSTDLETLKVKLEVLHKRYRRTPLGNPLPEMVAGVIEEDFDDRLDNILAARLLAEADMPDWVASGVLLHLSDNTDPVFCRTLLHVSSTYAIKSTRAYALSLAKAMPGCKAA